MNYLGTPHHSVPRQLNKYPGLLREEAWRARGAIRVIAFSKIRAHPRSRFWRRLVYNGGIPGAN